MEIVVIVIVFLLICIFGGLSSFDDSGSNEDVTVIITKTSEKPKWPHAAADNKRHRNKRSSSFEPSDSFVDIFGEEHEVDDDGYCEECDDYHDDY